MDVARCGPAWTAWIRLKRDAVRRAVPRVPGVDSIRRTGSGAKKLVFVGLTSRTLRVGLAGAGHVPVSAAALPEIIN
jgi:hypothetical protein